MNVEDFEPHPIDFERSKSREPTQSERDSWFDNFEIWLVSVGGFPLRGNLESSVLNSYPLGYVTELLERRLVRERI